jgi:hypothetical protein
MIGLALAIPVAAACAQGSAHEPSATPTLTLTNRNPLTVAGRHFTPRVKVRLVVSASGRQSQRVTPNRRGAFTATFTTAIDRCTIWSVTATQSGQARVLIRGGAKPGCAPAGAP